MNKSIAKHKRSGIKGEGGRKHATTKNYLRGCASISFYYFLLFFLDRYLFTPFLSNHFEKQVYGASSMAFLVALTATGIFLVLLPPLLFGRFSPERAILWGSLSFLCYALSNLATQNIVNAIIGKPLTIYIGFAYQPVNLRNSLAILYVLALFCCIGLLGKRCGIRVRGKLIRLKTRSYAVG